MSPRFRLQRVVVGLIAVALLSASVPAMAAPTVHAPTLVERLFSWFARLDQPEAERASAAGTQVAAPWLDPDGVEASLPPLDPGGTGQSTPTETDGEAAPWMDPDG